MKFFWPTHLLIGLSLETLTSIIRTGWPILVELIDLMNNNFPISNDFTQMVNFPNWITDCDSQTVILTVLLFWISFFLLMLLFVIQWLYLQLGNSDHVNVSVSIYFPSNSQQDALFHHIAFTILILNGTVFLIIWEMFHERMSLKSLLLLLVLYYVSRFRLELSLSLIVSLSLNVSIPHCKYQVIKPHTSMWF